MKPEVATVLEWDGPMLSERVHEAMRIYTLAMNYNHSAGAQRGVTTRWHTSHIGFACRAALTAENVLVGFGYGYTTKPGQWWHDLVRKAIAPQADEWLDNAFELSEIHVLPDYQGYGIGRELLLSLAGGIPHEKMLLSTPDRDTRAFRLYHHVGFVDLARDYLFPGDARPFAVLGAHLPLSATVS
jgi:ribosomal protein S18 acetylase RimI-like enzyme